jgi:hypothetical protein
VLGEVLAVGRQDAADASTGLTQMVEHFPRDGVQVSQIND